MPLCQPDYDCIVGGWVSLLGGQAPVRLLVRLTGPLRVTLMSGEDVTPDSMLRCALLAVLAAADGMTVSRARLQELFWGLADQKRAAGSLRSAVFQLRRDFETLGEEVIVSSKNFVSLAEGSWTVDRTGDAETFLEGMDLSLGGAESFEEWLREQRSGLHAKGFRSEADAQNQRSKRPIVDRLHQTSLGVLPVEFRTNDLRGEIYSAAALEALLGHLANMAPISIFDLRGLTVKVGDLDLPESSGRTLVLKPIVAKQDRELVLRLALKAPRSGRIVATFPPVVMQKETTAMNLLSIAEEVLDEFLFLSNADCDANLLPWAVLSSLFSLDSTAVTATELEVDRLLAHGDSPALESAKVFVQIFKEHEGFDPASAYEASDLVRILSKVPLNYSLRPLCESLIGYAAHMLCSDNDLSTSILESARKNAPNLAINLDHLAVLHLSQGNLSAARDAHNRCVDLSANSSWRYSYDITGSMIALAGGDYRQSLRLSNASLVKKPRFVGALRYAMIGFAMTNSADNARLMKRSILKLRPDYDLDAWVEGLLKRSDPVFANNVSITLKRHSLI